MDTPHIVIAGGSGFLGQALARHLMKRHYRVTILTRTARPSSDPAINYIAWDGQTLGPWVQALEQANAVVNLTGKSVNCRHTPQARKEILDSRINSVRVIAAAIRQCRQPPPVVVQASTLAIYGDRGDEILTESSMLAEGFSPGVARAWEQTFNETLAPSTRGVLLRIGFVLGKSGGPLQTLTKLARCFLGGATGSGRQYISWLQVGDMSRIFQYAIENPQAAGVYNVGTQHPVTNAQFMRQLRCAVGRPFSPPVPTPLVKFGARFVLRTEADLALSGRRCLPARLLQEGFAFQFAELREALADLYPDHHAHQTPCSLLA